jgi:parallel beta-helix repeat protein
VRGTIIALLAGPFVLLGAGASGDTYYVAPDGTDAGPGTKAAPWKALQRAADAARAGDTVVVRAGRYAGFVLGYDGPHGGTASRRITFRAEPGAVINARNRRTPDGINLENGRYVTLDGFTVTNAGGSITRAGIRAGGRGQGVVIRNNKVDGCGLWGVYTSFADDVLIENNVTSRSKREHGIYVANTCTRPTVRGNTSFGNRLCGIHMNGGKSEGGAGVITGALVEQNTVYDNGRAGGSGINCDGVQKSVLRNNVLYDNHAHGISLYRINAAAGSTDNVVANNTIVMAADARWALNIKNGSTGAVAFNNVLYNANRGRGSINLAADSRPGFTSDYNVVMDRLSPDDGGTFLTLARWQAATGQDKHSALTVPGLFVNAPGHDYHLAPAGPAVDKGTAGLAGRAAPADDRAGRPRPRGAGYDIGAYES